MNIPWAMLLAAEPARFHPFSGKGAFSEEPLEWRPYVAVLLFVLVATAMGVAVVRWIQWRKKKRRECPWVLFRELCRAHQLDFSQRRTLRGLALQQKLSNPAVLFTDERLLIGCDDLRRRLFE